LLTLGTNVRQMQLFGPWREMVSLGLTTWAEQPEPTCSDSHAWSAHPNYDLLTIVAGIRPRTAGFATVIVAPHLGSLKHLSVAVPNPKGMTEAEYTVEGSRVRALITLPADGRHFIRVCLPSMTSFIGSSGAPISNL